jgi:rubrerythrin
MEKTTLDEILDFAIAEEAASNKFYTRLAARMDNDAMRRAFEDFANEELAHKAKLEGIKKGGSLAAGPVADLKIADYVVEVRPRPDMDYQDALILAMKKEKAAFRLYNALAATTDDRTLRDTFLSLAQEEAKHKLRFEIEYDQVVLKED